MLRFGFFFLYHYFIFYFDLMFFFLFSPLHPFQVAAVSVFPETVAAHHMNDTCVVLGVVTDNFSSSSSSFVPSWEEGGLKDMVVKVCGVVQQFAKK